MANLNDQTIKDSYDQLIITENVSGLKSSDFTRLQDGTGDSSPVLLNKDALKLLQKEATGLPVFKVSVNHVNDLYTEHVIASITPSAANNGANSKFDISTGDFNVISGKLRVGSDKRDSSMEMTRDSEEFIISNNGGVELKLGHGQTKGRKAELLANTFTLHRLDAQTKSKLKVDTIEHTDTEATLSVEDTVFAANNVTLAANGTLETPILKAGELGANLDADSKEITNVNIDNGTIDGCDITTSNVTISTGKTLDTVHGTLTTTAAQKRYIIENAGIDLDIGAYELRAETFQSDVTTGIAPFTVASTTVVANLNADTVDGKDVDGSDGAGEITTNDGTQTLTNKTLTSPDINGGTIDSAVIGGGTPAAISGTAITGTSFVSSGDMTFGDNNSIEMGIGGDLEMYHDGNHSYIKETGSGNLEVETSLLNITGDAAISGTTSFADVDINGGNIDGTIIGANVSAPIIGASLTVSGTTTLEDDLTIKDGAVNQIVWDKSQNILEIESGVTVDFKSGANLVATGGAISLQADNTFEVGIDGNSANDVVVYIDSRNSGAGLGKLYLGAQTGADTTNNIVIGTANTDIVVGGETNFAEGLTVTEDINTVGLTDAGTTTLSSLTFNALSSASFTDVATTLFADINTSNISSIAITATGDISTSANLSGADLTLSGDVDINSKVSVTAISGDIATAGKFQSVGDIKTTGGDIILDSTNKLYLDGEGDTYITETEPNKIYFVTGGVPVELTGENDDFIFVYDLGSYPAEEAAISGNTLIGSQHIDGNLVAGASGFRNNCFIGCRIGQFMEGGDYNTLIGNSVHRKTGNRNTVMGFQAVYGWSDDNGDENVVIGAHANNALIIGDNNVLIGSGSSTTRDNSITIGQGANAYLDNTVSLGNSSTTMWVPPTNDGVSLGNSARKFTEVWATNGTIQTSDERSKESIETTPLGLSFINALRPVSYKYKDTPEVVETLQTEDGDREVITARAQTYIRRHHGLIAQEVKSVLDDLSVSSNDFAGYVNSNVKDKIDGYGLRYEEFIAPLIKAIQELTARVEELEA